MQLKTSSIIHFNDWSNAMWIIEFYYQEKIPIIYGTINNASPPRLFKFSEILRDFSMLSDNYKFD